MNSNSQIDLSQAGAGADAIGSAFSSFIVEDALPVLVGVLAACLVMWLIYRFVDYSHAAFESRMREKTNF